MKIEILGTGCAKCKAMEANAKAAVAQIGGFHSVVKVENIMEIMAYNIVSTPGLVVDGEVKSTGTLLGIDEIVELLHV
jgi:small redox-active disulfide protein 2